MSVRSFTPHGWIALFTFFPSKETDTVLARWNNTSNAETERSLPFSLSWTVFCLFVMYEVRYRRHISMTWNQMLISVKKGQLFLIELIALWVAEYEQFSVSLMNSSVLGSRSLCSSIIVVGVLRVDADDEADE